jgi:hypothetical protein
MSSAPTAEEISRDATWLAQALDPGAGTVRLVAMDRDSYRAASFLDDRLMQSAVDAQIVPWPNVEDAVKGDLRVDARWIFHIGHVGSTLVSRLLGEMDGVLAIREPRLLRDLATIPPHIRAPYLKALPKLMSRTFADEEIACVKATSFASAISPLLVPPGERTLFMYASPWNYIASILPGESSTREFDLLETSRARRLANRGIVLPSARSEADRAAAAWACEMTTLEAAAEAMPDRQIEWADFDAMLADMPFELGRIARFFHFNEDEQQLTAIATGPLMGRYSKDLNHEYTPALRKAMIDQELGLQGRAIDHAIAMLAAASENSTLLARALARAEK